MSELAYPVAVVPEGDDFVVIARDLPQVVTSGDTEAEAWELAADALDVVVSTYIEHELDLPEPSAPLPGERLLALPAKLSAKAAVYRVWKAAGIRKTELARRMGRSEAEVRRILNPKYGTGLDQLDEAARALGGRLNIQFEAA